MLPVQPNAVMTATHNYHLVALSIFIAVLASYTALDMAGRVTAAQGKWRLLWTLFGATAMGFGIWAMHYVGMLAFSLGMPMHYDVAGVLYSLLAAICAATLALSATSRPRLTPKDVILGSLAMGGAIATMHYIGMAAMRMQARVDYDWRVVGVSLLLAVVISSVALILSYRVREERAFSLRKVLSALVMGSAIPVMHYTGMASATFRYSADAPDLTHTISINTLGVGAISTAAFILFFLVLMSSFADRYLNARQAELHLLQESESNFRSLAEAIPQVVWSARADGSVYYCNRFSHEGSENLAHGNRVWEGIHPEDLPEHLRRWRHAISAGEIHDMELRLRGADGLYRWNLMRATPIRNAEGTVVKWYGTCTDIDDQKHSLQRLESQVNERTAQLTASNLRLQREMEEKEAAQLELNRQSERLVRELTESSKRNSLLHSMGELLQTCRTMPEAVSIVTGFAPRIFHQLRGALLLLNPGKTELEFAGSWSGCAPAQKSFEPDDCWALRTGRIHRVEVGDTSAPCRHAEGIAEAYFCVPIMAHGEAIGVLHFQASDGNRVWFDRQLSLPMAFSEQVGLSISNIRLKDMLVEQSIKDPLTGVHNRRYLEETLQREVKRSQRAGQPLGVIILDIDHFKTFNDRFGHNAGDVVLQELGRVLQQSVRSEDVVCRYGGEEFVVVLPGADLAASHYRAEQIRIKVGELELTYQNRPLGVITISAGVAAFPEQGKDATQILVAADTALYQAKKSGRNRVADSEDAVAPGAPVPVGAE